MSNIVTPSNIYSFERVFYHELGHFIAQEINKGNGINLGTERIEIEKKGDNYEGRTYLLTPDNYTPKIDNTLINFTEKIIEIAYGCIFEVIYSKTYLLKLCFDDNNYCNGSQDYQGFKYTCDKRHVSIKNVILMLLNEHIEDLKKIDFTILFNLSSEKYILSQKNETYYINLHKLRNDINIDINKVIPYYNDLVNKVNSKINQIENA